jgi:tRNA threonylcarbamoyladenosine biosynthesis protein TsaE
MIIRSEEEMGQIGAAIAANARPGDVIGLSGPLGVGKTSLARGFLRGLGYDGEVPSPSFSIVQPYEALEPAVWHVDLYRIEDVSEIDELGLDSLTDSVLLVEWPERAGTRAWPEALALSLNFGQDAERILTAKVPPSWESRWPPQ